MKWKKPARARIPLLCYTAALALWLVLCLGTVLGDTAARLSGKLAPHTLAITELELVSLEPRGENEWMATNADPQLIWVNPDGRRVRSLTLQVQHGGRVGEMALYYLKAYGEPFSREQRVFPVQNADGSYTFLLPETDVYALRLDPCSTAQPLRGLAVSLNTDCPLWWYWLPDWQQAFALLLVPGLAACALNILCSVRQQRQAAKRRKQP